MYYQIAINEINDPNCLVETLPNWGYVLYLPFETCRAYVLHEELSLVQGHGTERNCRVAYVVLSNQINALQLKQVVEGWDYTTIIEGYSSIVKDDNQVGHLTTEAQDDARNFLVSVVDCDMVNIVDYHEDSMDMEVALRLGLTADSSDAHLQEMADRHKEEIEACGAFLVGSIFNELAARREDMREEQNILRG